MVVVVAVLDLLCVRGLVNRYVYAPSFVLRSLKHEDIKIYKLSIHRTMASVFQRNAFAS